MATFFEQQHKAKKKTTKLIFLFTLAVIGIILGVYALLSGLIVYLETDETTPVTIDRFLQPELFLTVTSFITIMIVMVSFFKIRSLKAGGSLIAESLGGRLIDPSERGAGYAQLLDVVEEMAIASGTPVPPVYVLENEGGINAFAAGYSPNNAVIGVTRGAVDLLNRDELQAVIAHEFSHILNGDMGLNIKLIGYLAGIFSITIIGRAVLHRSRGSGRGAGPILLTGFGLLLLGFIGVIIGRIIKAAVSREREYLADASSIQFTRNPAGIYSALAKIAGTRGGSSINSAKAEEVSHMFFSNGIKNLTSRLFATHPPIESRLDAIKANAPEGLLEEWAGHADKTASDKKDYKENLKKNPSLDHSTAVIMHAAAAAAAAAAGQTVMNSMGRIDDAHITYAKKILEEIPVFVKEAAHETYGARAVIYCLLFDRKDAEIRKKQVSLLRTNADPEVFELARKLVKSVALLPYYCRLPLVDMTLPALNELSQSQYRVFKANVMSLIEADDELDVSEWTLLRTIKHHLGGKFEGRTPPAAKLTLEQPDPKRAAAAVFSMLADFSSDRSDIQNAFNKGAEEAGLQRIEYKSDIGIGGFDRALDLLEGLKPLEKEKFMKGCAVIIGSDREINEKEAEVFRVIGDSLNSPVPPIFPGQLLA